VRAKHVEAAMVEGVETDIGRDPRGMTEVELVELGHVKRPLLRVIRANCIECSGGAEAEVRRCRMVACPMWPYRMGTNPFHRQELSKEEREVRAERLGRARGARKSAL
jgi:hypothetical protein